MVTILASIAVFAFLIVALMLRVILGKDEEFRGTCGTMDPMLLAKGVKCGCGKEAGTCGTGGQNPNKTEALPEIGNAR